jgi:hypothetical protein
VQFITTPKAAARTAVKGHEFIGAVAETLDGQPQRRPFDLKIRKEKGREAWAFKIGLTG